MIVDDKVEDNDSYMAISIQNEFISYFLMQKMKGEETFTKLFQQCEQIPPFSMFRKHKC